MKPVILMQELPATDMLHFTTYTVCARILGIMLYEVFVASKSCIMVFALLLPTMEKIINYNHTQRWLLSCFIKRKG
jgi:hypothetical protein